MNSDIKIVKRVIPTGYADAIETDLLSSSFTWHYVNDVTNPNYGNNSGFSHVVYDYGPGQVSDWYPFIKPLVYGIAEATDCAFNELYRIRVGLLPYTDQPDMEFNTPHVDFLWPHYTACYYVTDSDGDTVLFDQTLSDMGTDINSETLDRFVAETNFTVAARSHPIKGQVCIFNGRRFHSSTKPRHHKRRLVITVNYR